MLEINAEAARRRLPELLDRAHGGEVSVIKKRGVPYAALVPLEQHRKQAAGITLLALKGSGEGLWGEDIARAIDESRREWD
jgi:prevent-host-death family protein